MTERKLEKSTKEQIRDILDEARVYYTMPPANGYGRSGNFDFVCNVRGAFLGIEAKRDSKEPPTTLQTENARAAQEAGGVTLLIHKDNLHVLKATVNALCNRMTLMTIPVNFRLGYWPPPPPPVNDTDVVLRRKKS